MADLSSRIVLIVNEIILFFSESRYNVKGHFKICILQAKMLEHEMYTQASTKERM